MKKRKRIVYIIFITAIILTISIVPVSANTVDVNVTGQYSSYSFNHGSISGSTVGFTGILSNIASNVVYTKGIYEYSQSIYSTADNIYRNCLTPITTNINYYLPTMNTKLGNIDTNIQTIGVTTDTIRTEMSLCKGYLQSIDNKLTNNPYMNPTVTTDEKNSVSYGIDLMKSIIPKDEDTGDVYVLDISTVLGMWSNTDTRTDITRKTTGYYNLYTQSYE